MKFVSSLNAKLVKPRSLYPSVIIVSVLLSFVVIAACARQSAEAQKMPALKAQSTPQAVVDEHIDALNHCDWNRLMAQYPENAEIFLPGGQVMKGREQVGEMFRNAVKPFNEGGLCGVTFKPEHTFAVGGTSMRSGAPVATCWPSHIWGQTLTRPKMDTWRPWLRRLITAR